MLSGRRFASSAITAFGVTAGAVVALAPGCGTPSRPANLPDVTSDSGGSALFVSDAGTGVPACNLGPNGNVCACVDQPLLGDVPNLYFVLDRSGSMNDDNKWGTIVNVLTSLVIDLGPRVNIGVTVFPSPSQDLVNACAAGVSVLGLSHGDAQSGEVGPTAKALLNTLGRVGAAGGTPTAATLTALLPLLKTFPGKTFVVLATDGGPNCDASASCDAAQCQPNIEGAPGCTGTGNCCVGAGGGLSCLDANPTTAAVQAISASGFPVFVVGVPGSAPYAALLDTLALAGNTARDPSGAGPQYYNVATTDQGAFQSALFQVAARVAGHCTLTLDAPPPNPDEVNVFLDEQPLSTGPGCLDPEGGEGGVPDATPEASALEVGDDASGDSPEADSEDAQAEPGMEASAQTVQPTEAGPEGSAEAGAAAACNWILQGQTVTIQGDACQRIMAGDVLDVRVVAGCPTVVR